MESDAPPALSDFLKTIVVALLVETFVCCGLRAAAGALSSGTALGWLAGMAASGALLMAVVSNLASIGCAIAFGSDGGIRSCARITVALTGLHTVMLVAMLLHPSFDAGRVFLWAGLAILVIATAAPGKFLRPPA